MASLVQNDGVSGDRVDFTTRTERFREVITLIEKTISKKPKNKAERAQFAKVVQDSERRVFDLIRSESQPIIFIFHFVYLLNFSNKS